LLRTRVITALAVAFVVSGSIFLLNPAGLALFFGSVALLASYEWANLVAFSRSNQAVIFTSFAGALFAGLFFGFISVSYEAVLFFGCLAWVVALLIVIFYPRRRKFVSQPFIASLMGVIIIWSAWVVLVTVRSDSTNNGVLWIFWVLLLVASCDIGAFFAGRLFGRKKLAPLISPGKTMEGAFGGILCGTVICGGILLLAGLSIIWLFYTVLLSAVCILGDLFESVLKRERGVKDSGSLLPGHGGILDRIDAILAVLPVFGLLFLNG